MISWSHKYVENTLGTPFVEHLLNPHHLWKCDRPSSKHIYFWDAHCNNSFIFSLIPWWILGIFSVDHDNERICFSSLTYRRFEHQFVLESPAHMQEALRGERKTIIRFTINCLVFKFNQCIIFWLKTRSNTTFIMISYIRQLITFILIILQRVLRFEISLNFKLRLRVALHVYVEKDFCWWILAWSQRQNVNASFFSRVFHSFDCYLDNILVLFVDLKDTRICRAVEESELKLVSSGKGGGTAW